MNLFGFFQKAAQKNLSKTALCVPYKKQEICYQDLLSVINKFRCFLVENNITPHTHVAIKLPNSIEWIVAFYGLLGIGAVPVLVEYRFTANETRHCLKLVNASCFIGDENDPYLTYSELNAEKKLKKILLFSDKTFDSKKGKIITCQLTELFRFSSKIPLPVYHTKTKIILFTYRGFGYPLAVQFSELALMKSVMNNIYLTKVNAEHCISHILPASHIFALTCTILPALSVGGRIIIMHNLMPARILESIDTYKINFLIAIPTLVKALIYVQKKKKFVLKSLKRGIIGGDICTQQLYQEWKSLSGCELMQGFGLTETCPVFCNNWSSFVPESIGKEFREVQAKIIDEKGYLLPVGKAGRLLIRAGSMMDGYLNKESELNGIFQNQWFDTGDKVYKDKNGFYYFVKRLKAIAKVGGNTVDTEEIKQTLLKHKDINHVKLTLKDDPLWQTRISVLIKADKNMNKQMILDWLKPLIAAYKIPKEILFE